MLNYRALHLNVICTPDTHNLQLVMSEDCAKTVENWLNIMATKKEFHSFEEMLAGAEIPVLVDFYADWCGPCQMMTPILEQVNAQLKDRMQVVKINTDKYPQIATMYQIHALPTLVLFKQAQQVDRIEGVLTAPQLLERLQAMV